MTTWPMVKLGDVVDIKTGKLDANASSPTGAFPFFTCSSTPLQIDNWAYDLDAVIVAGNGDLNVKHYNGKFNAYQRTYIITPKQNHVIKSRFLYYFMNSYIYKLRQQAIGGVIKYIKIGMLTEALIPLPPLAEQKRIAAILDQADTLRRQRSHALETLNTMGQAIFHEMFGEKKQDKKLRSYSRTTIEQSCTLINGKAFKPSDWSEIGIPIIRIQNLNKKESHFNYYNGNIDKKFYIKTGELLFAWSGTPGTSFGAHIWKGKDAILNQHIFKVLFNPSILNKMFLCYTLNASLHEQISKAHGGVGLKHITKSQFNKTSIPLPPLAEQERFAKRIEKVEALQRTYESALKRQETLFNALQQQAFRGEL